MTITEANKIFDVWSKWYWPTHIMLHSVFITKIPRSFLPYTAETLEEALNIVAEQYHNAGNYKAVKDIQGTMASLISYVDDAEALSSLEKNLTIPEFRSIMLEMMAKYNRDWDEWVEKQH